jgi:hypothetical protein
MDENRPKGTTRRNPGRLLLLVAFVLIGSVAGIVCEATISQLLFKPGREVGPNYKVNAVVLRMASCIGGALCGFVCFEIRKSSLPKN